MISGYLTIQNPSLEVLLLALIQVLMAKVLMSIPIEPHFEHPASSTPLAESDNDESLHKSNGRI